MVARLRELMTINPVVLESTVTVSEAARTMRDHSIEDVLVTKNGRLHGIVTDRDIVTRCIAEGHHPETMRLSEICNRDITAFPDTENINTAVNAMLGKAVRRIPIVDQQGVPLGVVSLADLSLTLDRQSALGAISTTPSNN